MRPIQISLVTFVLLAAPLRSQDDNSATNQLVKQSEQFKEQIVKVADQVFTAIGFSVSNVSMIIGDDGVVIVDTGMGMHDAERIVKEFRKITDKPVKAIIFTHGHGDHTGGAAAFLGKDRPQVWAHENFGSEAKSWMAGNLTIQNMRGARQAGFRLKPQQRINNGIAPVRYPKRGGGVFSQKLVEPTHFLDEKQKTINIAGVELVLVSSPGETNDQLFVWYPAGKVLFAGDNFYRSFPNLYAIRGTPNRSVRLWAQSMKSMVDKNALALVGGHTNPIVGAANVKQVLSDYHKAVQFIHDKTVEGMNQGLTPDELVEFVKLPKELASKDYLQPFYGHPEWGVRSVFNGYLGWFDGNPSNLFRLSPQSEAERLSKLLGGPDRLLAAAQQALNENDNQWAAQLADHLLAIDKNHRQAKTIKADALTKLARNSLNATARNYYLTVASELRQSANPKSSQSKDK